MAQDTIALTGVFKGPNPTESNVEVMQNDDITVTCHLQNADGTPKNIDGALVLTITDRITGAVVLARQFSVTAPSADGSFLTNFNDAVAPGLYRYDVVYVDVDGKEYHVTAPANWFVEKSSRLHGGSVTPSVPASPIGVGPQGPQGIQGIQGPVGPQGPAGSGGGGGIDVKSAPYNATGDGTTDDGPAIAAAVQAAFAQGGGRVYFPAGKYRVRDATTLLDVEGGGANDVQLELYGEGTASQILVDCAIAPTVSVMWTFANIGRVEIHDLAFIGYDQSRVADALDVLYFNNCREVHIHDIGMWGVGAYNAGIEVDFSGLTIEDCDFYGCALGQQFGWVLAYHWTHFSVHGCRFIDYGNLGGTNYSKTPQGMYCWVYVLDPAPAGGGSIASNTVRVTECAFDEGAAWHIRVWSNTGFGVFDRVAIEDCNGLIGVGGAVFVEFSKRTDIARYDLCSNNQSRYGIKLTRLYGPATVSHCTHDRGSAGTGLLYHTVDLDTPSEPSVAVHYEEVEWTATVLAQGDGTLAGDAAVVTGRSEGIPWRLRRASGAVAQFQLVKPAATQGLHSVWAHTDAAAQVTGVALEAAADAANVRIAEGRMAEVTFVSDGTTVIAPGDVIQPSTTVDGAVMKGTSNPLRVATTAAAATLNAPVNGV